MGVWSSVIQVLGGTQRRTADRGATPPIFERLEDRILLSADPLGLLVNDPSDDEGIVESAIVIDFDLTDPAIEGGSGTSDEGLQFPDHGSQIADIEVGITEGESQEGQSSRDELTAPGLVVSSPSESQPAPSDVEGITDDRLQTADDPPLITDY